MAGVRRKPAKASARASSGVAAWALRVTVMTARVLPASVAACSSSTCAEHASAAAPSVSARERPREPSTGIEIKIVDDRRPPGKTALAGRKRALAVALTLGS